MNKEIIFTQTERDILQQSLTQRLNLMNEQYADFFKNEKSRHYKNYVGSVMSVLQKLSQSYSCELTKWEKLSCSSVVNQEYLLNAQNPSAKIPYSQNFHFSILKKCKVQFR